MKTMLFALLASAAGLTLADDAYIDRVEGAKVGDTVQLDAPTLLYINKKCDLQFGGAQLMRFYAAYRGNKWDTGCWMRNLRGEAVIIVPKRKQLKLSLDDMARANVEKDGKARITALPKREADAQREAPPEGKTPAR